jgi:hypothetical protein
MRKMEIILVRRINVDNKIPCFPQVTSPRKNFNAGLLPAVIRAKNSLNLAERVSVRMLPFSLREFK